MYAYIPEEVHLRVVVHELPWEGSEWEALPQPVHEHRHQHVLQEVAHTTVVTKVGSNLQQSLNGSKLHDKVIYHCRRRSRPA